MALKCNIMIHQTLKVILSIEVSVAVMVHTNKLMCTYCDINQDDSPCIASTSADTSPCIVSTSADNSYSIPSAYLETCLSCDRLLKQNCVLVFKEMDYNMQHEIVKQCIRKKSACAGVKQFMLTMQTLIV